MSIEIHIDSSGKHMRIDRYLKSCYKQITQSLLEKNFRKGRILINGKKSLASSRLQEKDVISINKLLFEQIQSLDRKKPKLSTHKTSIEISQNILTKYLIFNHSEFIAINKPAGIAVQGGSGIKYCIDDGLSILNDDIICPQDKFRIVHRIDKETSGILLIAKNRSAATKLTQAFKDCAIKKKYYAVVLGKPTKKSGIINKNLTDKKGILRNAITHFNLVKQYDDYAFMSFEPITGRTHQIRIHCLELSCPIIGDTKYGGKQMEIFLKKRNISSKLMLNSSQLILPKEIFNKKIILNALLPDYFEYFIK